MSLKKVCILPLFLFSAWSLASAQAVEDKAYIQEFVYPYVARLSLEQAGAGIQISPDNTVTPATASFPFNTGTNLALNVYYKFLNFSISQSLNSRTNNKSFVVALNETQGPITIGGKLGIYGNVASLDDQKTVNTKSSINLIKFSPYWLANFNHTRFSLAAVTDFSRRQRQSAGALMFEVNPFILSAKGKDGYIVPLGTEYESQFEQMAGLRKFTLYNLDIRPGYMYTLSFSEGTYLLSGGLFVGAGFGYHQAKAEAEKERGFHWQTSARILATAAYNQEKYFVAASLRYNNSFTPVKNIGILANESVLQLTFGFRFNSFEKTLPSR